MEPATFDRRDNYHIHAQPTTSRRARAIEEQTAKLLSDTFLWAALGAIGLALALKFTGRKHDALFVGHWAPTLLLLGIYNKLVKLHGADGPTPGSPSAMDRTSEL